MIVLLGLVVMAAAVIADVTAVLANGGHAHAVTHFAVFGYHVTGSTGTLFPIRRGGGGRRSGSRAGLPRGAVPRGARRVSAGPGEAGQPGDVRPGRRAADPAAARDGG